MEYNVKNLPYVIIYGSLDSIELAKDRVQFRVIVSTVIHLCVP